MDNLHIDQHISRQFNADLELLREHLMEMGGLVEEQVSDAVKAIENADSALAEKVLRTEEDIDRREVELDEECTRPSRPASIAGRPGLGAGRGGGAPVR